MARGGARPGAGRKPKAEKFKLPIARAERRIADRLPELIDNLFALAAGVAVEEADAQGHPRVYSRPPCYKSNAYLIDRILGKPKQAVEVGGPGGAPLAVPIRTVEVVNPDGRSDDDRPGVPGGDV
jgi:hypothetical protein